MKTIIVMLLASLSLFADDAKKNDDGDSPVTVAKKYVSAEGLQHQVDSTSKWVGIGREVGAATREGLESVVDVSNKFGETKVGTFVMVMVAWHVIGTQVLRVVLGIPLFVSGALLWGLIMRRFFWGYQVKTRRNADKSIEYETRVYKWRDDGDCRVAAGATAAVAIIVWCVAGMMVILA